MAILACAKSLIQLSLLPRLRIIADRRLQTRSGAPCRSCPLGARRPVFAPRPRSCFWSKPHVGTPAPRSLPAGIRKRQLWLRPDRAHGRSAVAQARADRHHRAGTHDASWRGRGRRHDPRRLWLADEERSEERRVGKEWCGTCRSRWAAEYKKKKIHSKKRHKVQRLTQGEP